MTTSTARAAYGSRVKSTRMHGWDPSCQRTCDSGIEVKMSTRSTACRRARRERVAVVFTAAALPAGIGAAAALDASEAPSIASDAALATPDQTPPDDDSKQQETGKHPGHRPSREPVLIQSDKPWLFN